MAPGLPTREEVEGWLVALVMGSRSRDEADRWAAQWFNDVDVAVVGDDVVWWALGLLHGIDMPVDRDGTFLHDDEQVRQWLVEFRGRCGTRPVGGC
jgi:hypothetical protein